MNKMQEMLLDLLLKFDEICEKNNLEYFLEYGTLLGAVREHGFIPWDDDIDVVMHRKDYDKLIHRCGEQFQEPYFLQSAYSDVNYYRGHSQLRRTDTCGALIGEAGWAPFNQGMFLDIFVLDNRPLENEEIIEEFDKLCNYRNQMSRLARESSQTSMTDIRELYSEYEDVVRSVPETGFVDKILYRESQDSMYYRLKKEWFSKPKRVLFENYYLPIPKAYDNILKAYYGEDYMTPVQSMNSHGEMIIDLNQSYKEVLRERREKHHQELNIFLSKMQRIQEQRLQLYIYGVGAIGKSIATYMLDHHIEFLGFVVTAVQEQTEVFGKKVYALKELASKLDIKQVSFLLAVNDTFEPEIKEMLLGFGNSNIITISPHLKGMFY